MNHPHYVIDWNALDEEIDHCEKHYQSNALAPLDRDEDDVWNGDERPTGFDFIEYHRAESNLLGKWQPPAPKPVRITRHEFMNLDETAAADRFERITRGNNEIDITTLLDCYGRPIAVSICTTGTTYYRIDNRQSIDHDRRKQAINAFEQLVGIDDR